jgi:hypothetical protein
MNASIALTEKFRNARQPASPPASQPAIKLIVIHEDFSSGNRALRFAEQFADSIGCSCDLSNTVWRSDFFDDAEIAADAACAAADADYVIVSLLGERVLPVATRNWIEAWLIGSSRFAAGLIVLAEIGRCRFRVVEGTCRYLRSACAVNGVGFYTFFMAAPEDGPVEGFWDEEEAADAHELWKISPLPAALSSSVTP